MEGLGVVVFVVWVLASLFGRAMKESRGGARQAERERARAAARERAERLARAGASPPERGADHGGTPTQLEARRLEELLRGLGDVLGMPEEEEPVVVVRRGPVEPEAPEEAYSLEGTSIEVESGEVAPTRAARAHVSADEAADAVVQRRIAAASARSGALGPADHEAFHQRLARQDAARAPVPVAARPRRPLADLRRAVVWREILGPPLALREGGRD